MHLMSTIMLSSVLLCSNVYATEQSPHTLIDIEPHPLTNTAGDANNGRVVVLDRNRGHCLLCHQFRRVDEKFQGNIGPDLSTVGARLTPAQLRYRLIDFSRLNPHTPMPAYYRTQNLRQVDTPYQNKPVLSAQEIEDVVAYLSTLTEAD